MPFFIIVDIFAWLPGLHSRVRACACAGRAHSGAGPRRASSPLTGSRWEPPSIQAVQSLACPQRLLFAACHSDSARSRVSARARALGTVGQPPRRDAKRPQRRVNTAASAVSAAVRRQKWTFLPEEPTAVPSHRGRRLLLVSVGPNSTTPRHSKEMYWALQSESDSSHYEDRGQSCSKSALDCRSLKRLLLVCQVKKTGKKKIFISIDFQLDRLPSRILQNRTHKAK